MHPRGRRVVATALLSGLLLLPAAARAQTDSDVASVRYGAQTFDLVVLRPLGLAAAAVGAAFLPVAVLLAAPGGLDPVVEALEVFVLVPGKNVFTRPLGEF